jgi:hypothetical protein
MLRPPPGASPFILQLVATINSELLRREPILMGWINDATDINIRFRAALVTPWVQVHVQTDQAGEGGADYDTTNYKSSTEIDCRAERVQDVTIPFSSGVKYYVWLVPKQQDGADTKVMYDGEGGRPDNKVFWSMEH